MPQTLPRPEITVLMATCQGAAHLPAQLASLAAQQGVDWALWVSDDGSTDGTWEILDRFRRETAQPVRLLRGPRRGAAANFLSLLCHPDLPAGAVALSDQDDLWYPDKLARALTRLTRETGPAVYTARSRHVAADGTPLGASRALQGPPGFGNAQVENRVSGHAAVLNSEALALVRAAGPVTVPFHDWWLYLLITGAGGGVISDPAQVLDYRQHGQNVLGAPRGGLAALHRAALVLGPVGQGWMAQNRAALAQAMPLLTPEARHLLDALSTPPHRGLARARRVRRMGLTRQGATAQALIWLAAVLGRL